jgi:S-adenosylmethionine hydrolase
MLRPMTYPDMIKGSVIYIDHFYNAITNIKKNEFDAIRKERSYEIQFSKNILQLSETYSNVPEGEKLCLFNSIGLLEIAINKGNASSLLNLKGGSTIQIFFK